MTATVVTGVADYFTEREEVVLVRHCSCIWTYALLLVAAPSSDESPTVKEHTALNFIIWGEQLVLRGGKSCRETSCSENHCIHEALPFKFLTVDTQMLMRLFASQEGDGLVGPSLCVASDNWYDQLRWQLAPSVPSMNILVRSWSRPVLASLLRKISLRTSSNNIHLSTEVLFASELDMWCLCQQRQQASSPN